MLFMVANMKLTAGKRQALEVPITSTMSATCGWMDSLFEP